MTGPIVRFGRLSPDRLERLHLRAREAHVTYDHIGSTLPPDRGPDRRPSRHDRCIGSGDAAFDAAVGALRAWVPQHGIGARIYPPECPLELGATVLVVLPLGPAAIVAPNRIVAIVEDYGIFGFAYGTLPGHPEQGEESFVIRQDQDGTVTASVQVDARPAHLATRIGAPVVGALQRVAIKGYLKALYRVAQAPNSQRGGR